MGEGIHVAPPVALHVSKREAGDFQGQPVAAIPVTLATSLPMSFRPRLSVGGGARHSKSRAGRLSPGLPSGAFRGAPSFRVRAWTRRPAAEMPLRGKTTSLRMSPPLGSRAGQEPTPCASSGSRRAPAAPAGPPDSAAPCPPADLQPPDEGEVVLRPNVMGQLVQHDAQGSRVRGVIHPHLSGDVDAKEPGLPGRTPRPRRGAGLVGGPRSKNSTRTRGPGQLARQ